MRMLPKSLSPRALTHSRAVKHKEILGKKIWFCFCYHRDIFKDFGNRCKKGSKPLQMFWTPNWSMRLCIKNKPDEQKTHLKWSPFQKKSIVEVRHKPVTSAWVWINNSFLVSPPQRDRVSMKCPALFMLSIMWRVPCCKWKKSSRVLHFNQYFEKLWNVYLYYMKPSRNGQPRSQGSRDRERTLGTRLVVFSHDVTATIILLVSQNNETAAMLVCQTHPVGVELFSCAIALVCSNNFAWLLTTWAKTLKEQ